jgi:hypothetical protein
MFKAVQIQTDAFVHFDLVLCNQYIVCGATGGRPDRYRSRRSGSSGQGRRSSIE